MKTKYSLLLILKVGILALFINMTNIWVESQNSDLLGNSERVSVENRFIFNKKENMILYETTDEFAEIYEYIDSELEKAKKDLEDTIASRCYTEAEVDAKLAALNTAISNAQKAAELYADNQDLALKQEIEASIADTKTEVYEYIDSELEQVKKDLENTIASRCYTEAEVDAKLAALNATISTAQKAAELYADNQDAALKQEIEASIADTKTEVYEYIDSELEQAKKDLEDTIASRCYTEAEVDAKLAALNTTISTAQKAAELYADNQDVALKQEIEASIADTKTEICQYLDSKLEQAKKDLENTITSRCYTEAEVDAEIARLSDLIRKAEKVAKEYADDNDSAFKQELDASIVSAKTELLDAINIIDEKYEQKINILNGEISNIQSEMKTLSIILYSCIGLLTSCILVIVFILTKKRKTFK